MRPAPIAPMPIRASAFSAWSTAKALGTSFQASAERLFADLGLKRTYIVVPAAEMKSYAWGYSRDNKPSRVSPALLAVEAYGVKSNAVDMLRFLEANMGVGAVPAKIARALEATHTGYFRAGELIQDLIWEQYPWPVTPEKLAAGNASQMALKQPHPATAINPPMAPRGDVLINKTGSTNGFGAYAAVRAGEENRHRHAGEQDLSERRAGEGGASGAVAFDGMNGHAILADRSG